MRPALFETERLFASDWDVDRDAAAAHAMYADAEVVRFIPGLLSESVEQQRERLEALIARDAELGFPFGGFPFFRRDDESFVGLGLLQPLRGADREWIEGVIEVGWHLPRPCWGHGYATEIGRALLARGFAHLDVDVIHAVVDPDNHSSHAVARRLGMALTGRTDRYYGMELELYEMRRPPAR